MRIFVQIQDTAVAIDDLVVIAKQDKDCIRLHLKGETSMLIPFTSQERRDLVFDKTIDILNEIALKQINN